jgi:Uma2 family endonuclease
MTMMKIKGSATVEDLLKTPKDGQKYELVDGEIVVSPTGMRHGEVALKISHTIATFLENNPIGRVYGTDVGITFPNDNIRSPDVLFVRTEKLPGGKSPVGFGELIPDLCVEVLSPSDSVRHVAQKIGEFLECGVPIVWLVDPGRKSVTVYRSLSQIEQYQGDDVITAEPILPGFSCPVSRFFS